MSSPDTSPSSEASPEISPDVRAAQLEDKYDRMLRLAALFDQAGEEMRQRAKLGTDVLADEAVSDSAEVSPSTWREADNDIREATTGKHGLLTRSIELDADALVVRATVLTYRWIDELQEAAYQTLGSIAGRAIGYLAPEVALGGAIVSAGLIETDAVDRDGVARYLSELAENNPELMDHVSTGGGLLDGLQMRALLTVGALAGDSGPAAARGGLRSIGVDPFAADTAGALRDAAAAGSVAAGSSGSPAVVDQTAPPRSVEELMLRLTSTSDEVVVSPVGEGRFIGYLPGHGGGSGRLRLVGGDASAYAGRVVAALDAATDGVTDAKVMLVGSGHGGVTAATLAATPPTTDWAIEQVVTAGAPSASAPVIPDATRVLSLEDRADPVALLGSLINARATNRITVVFDGATVGDSEPVYVAGGRAADTATHGDLRAELARLRTLGYLA